MPSTAGLAHQFATRFLGAQSPDTIEVEKVEAEEEVNDADGEAVIVPGAEALPLLDATEEIPWLVDGEWAGRTRLAVVVFLDPSLGTSS